MNILHIHLKPDIIRTTKFFNLQLLDWIGTRDAFFRKFTEPDPDWKFELIKFARIRL